MARQEGRRAACPPPYSEQGLLHDGRGITTRCCHKSGKLPQMRRRVASGTGPTVPIMIT
ncbi:hypothetical protein PXO_02213 [Xanthomonas oryzae pv. oryzae PXO99A]|nr:hypothetical protein PXO_02213 [Xanthomonas oryzae pv. oryzae PXO99A]